MIHPNTLLTLACLATAAATLSWAAWPLSCGNAGSRDCLTVGHRHATPEGATFCREMTFGVCPGGRRRRSDRDWLRATASRWRMSAL
jgi:hypothetical protein